MSQTVKPAIIIAGMPDWTALITEKLTANYEIIHQSNLSGYFNTLVDSRAAMILINGDIDERYITIPKTSPATRRIPVVLVSDQAEIRANAITQGADLSLTQEELVSGITKLVKDYARTLSEADIEQLNCDCDAELPELARQGIAKFNAGEYYKQHDLFEELWVQTEGNIRDLYRAILQVGVAYYQIQRGNYRGALKMFQRSVQWLLILPDTCQGVNVKKLREDSFRVRAELERLGESRLHEFDHSLIQGIEWNPES